MASICRSASITAVRSAAFRSRALLPKPMPSRRTSSLISRSYAPALVAVESMMPLHSATAAARLTSNIAVDSSCWSWLSGDFAVPR